MTDPAPSPPAGQPPIPDRPMPRLGGGLVWSDVVAKIDRDHRARQVDAEPAASPEVAEEEVPQVEELNSQPGRNLEQLGVEAPVVDVTKPGFGIVSIAEARSWGITPPPAVELLAMADDLNAHGGLDETFVAALLQSAAADAARPGGIISIPTELTDEQMEQLRADWQRNLDAGPRPMRVIGEGPPFRGYLREIVDASTEHQHIWSATSPMRCVECRRYLRPWWRRTLDRVWWFR